MSTEIIWIFIIGVIIFVIKELLRSPVSHARTECDQPIKKDIEKSSNAGISNQDVVNGLLRSLERAVLDQEVHGVKITKQNYADVSRLLKLISADSNVRFEKDTVIRIIQILLLSIDAVYKGKHAKIGEKRRQLLESALESLGETGSVSVKTELKDDLKEEEKVDVETLLKSSSAAHDKYMSDFNFRFGIHLRKGLTDSLLKLKEAGKECSKEEVDVLASIYAPILVGTALSSASNDLVEVVFNDGDENYED